MTRYRPSNGTEGEYFQAKWCARCRRFSGGICRILMKAQDFDIDDPNYPAQWRYQDGGAVCTAFRAKDDPRSTPNAHTTHQRQIEKRGQMRLL